MVKVVFKEDNLNLSRPETLTPHISCTENLADVFSYYKYLYGQSHITRSDGSMMI